MPEGEAGSGSWLARAPLVAAAVAFATYAPSLAGGFLYDDEGIVLMNPSIRDWRALGTVLRYEPSRPVLSLTWALNYAIGGLQPWSYHLVNVSIHAANAALLASLFLWMARRWSLPDPRRSALLGACLFAASPMAAETVAYVASRSSALVTLFALGCLRLAASVLAGGLRSRLIPALALFLLGLATKEEAAAVPLLLLLVDFFFVAGQRWSELRRRWWIHAGFLMLLPLGLLARRAVTGTWLPAPAVPTGIYLLTQWAAFPLYFLRALVPIDPAFYRYHPPASWPPGLLTVAGCLITLALAVLAIRFRRRWPAWSFAACALAAGLLPSSSVVALHEMVVDHRAYLASFGMAFAMGGLLWSLGRARLGAVVVAILAALSMHYQWVLADPVRAWEDAVRRAPGSPDALCALGEAYAARRDPRAEALFVRATSLLPGHYRYWANLGLYYSENSRLEEAVPALQRAASQAPRNAAVRDYLGQVLQRLGREDEALAEFQGAIAAEPGFVQAYIDLAALWMDRGQPEKARPLLTAASRLPTEPEEAEAIVALQRKLP